MCSSHPLIHRTGCSEDESPASCPATGIQYLKPLKPSKKLTYITTQAAVLALLLPPPGPPPTPPSSSSCAICASLARLRSLPEHDPRVQAEHLTILAEVAVNKEVAALRHPSLDSDQLGSKTSLWQAFVRETKEWRDAFSKRYMKRTVVGAGVAGFQQFTGINALIY